jgi:hypothetical protein
MQRFLCYKRLMLTATSHSPGDVSEKLGGILAIEELVHVLSEANETKIIRFANYLRQVILCPGYAFA